jgi:cyclophilin family peptidyl-prolyl cis-trans isomerase
VPSADKRQRKKENARAAREARQAAEKRSKRLRTFRNVGIVVGVFIVVVVLVNVVSGGSSKKKASSSTTIATTTPTTAKARPTVKLKGFVADPTKTYTAKIDTNFGPIVVKLDSKNAPKAAGRFIELSRAGFYNGLQWVRAAKDFVIQGGSPDNTQSGGSGNPSIVGEVPTNNYPVGSLAAAKTGSDPNGTMDSQFFIVTGSGGKTLPNQYARFGSVTSGIENAQKIEALAPASGDGPPTQTATIDKITITES